MKLRLQLLMESDTGEIITTEEVIQLERHSLQPEEVGLTLADAKQILSQVQRTMVQEQVAAFLEEQSHCPDCDRLWQSGARVDAERRTATRIASAGIRPYSSLPSTSPPSARRLLPARTVVFAWNISCVGQFTTIYGREKATWYERVSEKGP